LKANRLGDRVLLDGALLVPQDRAIGETVSGEVSGYVTVAYHTSSVLKEAVGLGKFSTRRMRIRYPLRVEVAGGKGSIAPAGLQSLDSVLTHLPVSCRKYLDHSIVELDRGWLLAVVLAEPPRHITRDEFDLYTRDMPPDRAELYYYLRMTPLYELDTMLRSRNDFLKVCGRASQGGATLPDAD
jgi:hypothetical protein